MNAITQTLINDTVAKQLTTIPEIKANPNANEQNSLGFTFNDEPFKVELYGDIKYLQINPVFYLEISS